MHQNPADAHGAAAGGSSRIRRFLEAIGYPGGTSVSGFSSTLLIDGSEMTATDAGGVLRLEFRLTDDKTQLPRIASLAAGRMLREDAVPAFGGEGGHAFLWQNLPADADASAMRRGFESFAASCDWWRERLSGAAQDTEETPRPEMMIRP